MSGVSSAPEQNQRLRVSLNLLRGINADGGHLETKGLSTTGQVIEVPAHRHEVSLDFLRVEVGLAYRFARNWKVGFSLPYEVKDQNVSIERLERVSPAETRAILANQNIHHRDETYRGLADLNLLLSHRKSGVLSDDDQLVMALGVSIPTGKTEENPFKLGNAGKKHLHIQFGTGTFDPLAELHYRMPLLGRVEFRASVRGRFPFYENRKTYRGSAEVTSTAEVEYRVRDWLSLHTTYLGFYQSYAHWAGERDINSGLLVHAGVLGATVTTGYGIRWRVDLMSPLSQKTLSDEGDTFEQGPIVFLSTSRSF